ncbi:putative F-box/LRR-repeat protein At5g41840 [Vitis riparia]|uniref:putative F-box/LRR-repeat protein At5g41840 n=1 Tax=Vitis riparia TaxID=96939 RepID=UPI00155B114C|nr:putative F-box/LRR-repeat protein At5g41840 [Vitis riparia]
MAEEQIDRISQMPDDILRSILSLLPTRDLARTNLVSKAWRKLFAFSSLPVLMFQSPDFLAAPRKDTDVSSFINAIDSYLKLRQKDASLEKLRLHVHLNDVKSLLDSWIDAALERKVKELDLYILPRGRERRNPYSLPAKIFAATTITVLSLQRVIMEIYGDIDLPALRKLYLGEIQCDEQPIQKLISSCPLIDCLRIESCHGLQKLHVSGLANLRRLEVRRCYELKRIEINAPSLQYLRYQQGRCPCDVVLRASEFLRELTFWDSTITEDLFQNLVSGLPSLEGLGIRCTQLQRIEISHHQLSD